MLKWRVLTALVLAPVFLWAVWYWPVPYLAILFGAVASLGAWEWGALIGLPHRFQLAAYVVGLWVLLGGAWWYMRAGLSMLVPLLLTALWWAAALNWLKRFSRRPEMPPPRPILAVAIGYLLLVPCWFSLIFLRLAEPDGAYWITLLLLLVWGADIGAFMAGRRFGRRKLAPTISPGKSREGVMGGIVLALGAAAAFHFAAGFAGVDLWRLLGVALITVLFSVVGDLFESMVKRQHLAKDSGTLLPGHGGVLDRIDSLTIAAPVFLMGLLWIQSAP